MSTTPSSPSKVFWRGGEKSSVTGKKKEKKEDTAFGYPYVFRLPLSAQHHIGGESQLNPRWRKKEERGERCHGRKKRGKGKGRGGRVNPLFQPLTYSSSVVPIHLIRGREKERKRGKSLKGKGERERWRK